LKETVYSSKLNNRLPFVCKTLYLKTGRRETRALIIPLPISADEDKRFHKIFLPLILAAEWRLE